MISWQEAAGVILVGVASYFFLGVIYRETFSRRPEDEDREDEPTN